MSDLFGRPAKQTEPDITGYEVILETALNAIADSILLPMTADEQLEVLAFNRPALIQFVTTALNENFPEGLNITYVGQNSMRPIINKIVEERKDQFYATVTVNTTGNGRASGGSKYRKGDTVEIQVSGVVVSSSETIVDGVITITGIQDDIIIDIIFEEPAIDDSMI